MSPVSSFAFLAAESCPLIPLSIRNNRLTTFSTVKCDGWETYFHWVLFSITLAAFWRTIDLIDRFLTKIRSAFWANHFFRPSFIVFSLFLLSYHQLLQFRMSFSNGLTITEYTFISSLTHRFSLHRFSIQKRHNCTNDRTMCCRHNNRRFFVVILKKTQVACKKMQEFLLQPYHTIIRT